MCHSPRLLGALLLLALLGMPFLAPPASDARPASCSVPADGWKGYVSGRKIKPTHPKVEKRVIVLVNRFRRAHGLRPLKLDPGLRYAARARGVKGHRLSRLGRYSPSPCIAENVVRKHRRSAASIVRTWRRSEGFRQVLLLPWARRIGVGVRASTFKGERVTIATADISAAHPRSAKRVRAPGTRASKAHRASARQTVARGSRAAVQARRGPARASGGRSHLAAPVTPDAAPVQPSAPAVPTPAPPLPAAPVVAVPTGPVVGVPYTCDGPVNGVRVVGTGAHARSLVNIAAGCTGTLSFDIHVTSGGGDGVKVQPGAHDLTIGPSRIVCDRLIDTSFHQDGVQVQGGSNVTFNGLSIICPYVTGQGAAGFYIDGKDFSGISNVVCDGCNLEHWHYGAMFTGPAPGSGVRNSIIHQGGLTHGYFEKVGDPFGLVDENNVLAPHCDGGSIPC
jgi:hypothetical protein